MKIDKLDVCPLKNPNLLVKVTEMGNVIEIQYMDHRNNKQTIRMLPGGLEYMELATGEVRQCQIHNSRAEQKKSLYRTFKIARGLINANVTDVKNVRWITLTYGENMTDTNRLYEDFHNFIKRTTYYFKGEGISCPEYIVMMEPQGRGAWHCHLLFIWDKKAPYIANKTLRELWQQGFVKIKKLDNVDNVGAYLTAYLGDMEIQDCADQGFKVIGETCKTVEIEGKSKSFIKGARLCLYPAKFNMIRSSRGVKRPTEEMMSQIEAEKKVSSAKPTYEKTIKLIDESTNFECLINTVQYNKLRK